MSEQLLYTKGALMPDALKVLGNSDVITFAENKRVIISKFPKKPSTETWDGGERTWVR